MTVKDITQAIEEIAPLSYSEDFDNTGLLIGSYDQKVSKALITLDTLETVVEEAIEKQCELIISFHPIIFSGLKKLNGSNYVQRTVIKAIKHNIAIYAIHTALDLSFLGVNRQICKQLKLENPEILIPKKGIIKKLTTYVPIKEADKLRKALFDAGAGNIGNYDMCSFNNQGKGTFRGKANSNPTVGKKLEIHFEDEIQLNVVYHSAIEKKVLKALFETHPYEEIAYELYALDNKHQQFGMGMIGKLSHPMDAKDFLNYTKKAMKTKAIRHSAILEKHIQKVAVLGGSGSFAIQNAIKAKADAYITADLKYHDFFKAEKKILLVDVGHYESEQFTKKLLVEHLSKKMPKFATLLSEINTNPVKYL